MNKEDRAEILVNYTAVILLHLRDMPHFHWACHHHCQRRRHHNICHLIARDAIVNTERGRQAVRAAAASTAEADYPRRRRSTEAWI